MAHYYVTPVEPNAHHFAVTCTVSNPDPEGARFCLPSWIPGSYKIRDFSRNLFDLRAETESGEAVELTQIDKRCWRCEPTSKSLSLHYRIYAWELSVRTAYLDQFQGFFNGTSLFVAVEGEEETPHRVTLTPPSRLSWEVSTTLPVVATDPQGWGDYQAADYHELIDHPVTLGQPQRIDFDVGGTPHTIIVSGNTVTQPERLASDLQRICECHCRLFNSTHPPSPHYLFHLQVVDGGYGGLEHRDSTALICSREDLPQQSQGPADKGYRRLLGLCSHEYLHLWMVKRIRPLPFSPHRLDSECYTRQLWAYEGFVSYLDDLALVQSGVISRDRYLELLGQNLSRLERNRGQLFQRVTDSSLEAWTKLYQADENAGNSMVSYYTKGAAIALMLDLHLRHHSDHRNSLATVMEHLWQRYGLQGLGTAEGEIEQLCHQLAGDEIPFLQAALYATTRLEIAPLLQPFGIELQLRPSRDEADLGGTPATELPRSWLGARLNPHANGVEVESVVDGGPAQQAGIAARDRLIALNQLQATAASIKTLLQQPPPTAPLSIHLFRRDQLMTLSLTLQPPPDDTVVLQPIPFCSPEQNDARERWLHPTVA